MKAILVIDIPKYYEIDQLAVNYMLYSDDGKILDGDMGIELKPLPQKYELTTEKGNRYAVGWNDCIDEIMGGTDESNISV